MTRRLSVLGSTGSIGRSTLDVVAHMGGSESCDIVALTGHDNIDLLAMQAKRHNARLAVTSNPRRYGELKAALAGSGIEVGAGPEALIEAASQPADIVMAGIVGIAGLAPTLAAASTGADIALANKECLVCAGNLFLVAIASGGGRLLPVDSEHNAIFQVLETDQRHAVERIILTASGGPFRTLSRSDMAGVTPKDAAAHPNWSMGLKISIDSASMFNKALEMIEAHYLFDMPPDAIEVIVHPQSIIHSMVGYSDGSVLAQLGAPDMRTAIGYALGYPRRLALPVERLDFAKLARLDFHAIDAERFPAIDLARRAMRHGHAQGAVLNGAKEAALDAFIAGRIGFLDMVDIVDQVMDHLTDFAEPPAIEAVFEADRAARDQAERLIAAL
ncbi:1-deoxy-D-xylulose-5-phosphate reductoisomerase [Pseudohoeflea coraliihabitans]|uniref:1-deoxy-D-xylulose 5-phosphate reductoisomerase n=1 Tax=Pseudohoeflea coraliihabitans TaxID=2860393 RepID=A0ABS6WN68_9HYPH|nr:1-deoxy-D-xylulose-5-phosphate reductoisomerase [Pseudohoeflea sp. DP4N28-3]MBW3096555.1 1-deoxy-D-xylulose-5-phosphate reductoisomerase [Pseudohoeflea sp. DP4N28-3]